MKATGWSRELVLAAACFLVSGITLGFALRLILMRSGAIKYVAETMGVLAVCSIVFSAIAVLCLSDDLVAERLEKGGKRSALCLLDAWAAILPIRIAKEDLGDYREDIERRADAGQRWLLWLRVITALVWTGINAVGFVSKNLLGKEVESPPDKQPSK